MNQIPRLSDDHRGEFPPTRNALDEPNGLLAWGGELSAQRLLKAYSLGIFPWYSEPEPVLWWSPAPRCVLFPHRVHVSRRLEQKIRQNKFKLTADTAFDEVLSACAGPRPDGEGTWITGDLREAFRQLHQLGHAHSIEAWEGKTLAGGVYGLSLGKVFFAESMFHHVTDAGKIALVGLCKQLQQWGYSVIDCQVENPHLVSLGTDLLERDEFERLLETDCRGTEICPGSWTSQFSDLAALQALPVPEDF